MAGKAKPVGSLGALETLACRLAALQGTLEPEVGRTCLMVFAADHGITAARPEISAFPREVSVPVFRAIVRGQAASAVMAASTGATLLAVDVGLDGLGPGAVAPPAGGHIALMTRKVRPHGSRNMLEGPAMSEDELAAALAAGAEAVRAALRGSGCGSEAADGAGLREGGGAGAQGGGAGAEGDGGAVQGAGAEAAAEAAAAAGLPGDWRRCVLCLGEVGIGNTTAAAALLAALTGAAPEAVCGRGTGVDDAGLAAKVGVVRAALAANADLLRAGGPLGCLRAVGGLELAAMAGAALEAGRLGVPLVVDGFISGAAALAALAADPSVGRVLLLSHSSAEAGAGLLLRALRGEVPLAAQARRPQGDTAAGGAGAGAEGGPGAAAAGLAAGAGAGAEAEGMAAAAAGGARAWPAAAPAVLSLGMRLGEGTGALLLLPLLRSAAAVMRHMGSLAEVLAAE